jgi:hypothetical protein
MSNPIQYATGLTTPVVGGENFLSSPNAAGTYILIIDTVNMVAGDILEIRIYKMTVTGGTTRVVYIMTYYGAQPTDDLIKTSVPVGNDLTDVNAVRFSIKQTFGTARNFPWTVLQYT